MIGKFNQYDWDSRVLTELEYKELLKHPRISSDQDLLKILEATINSNLHPIWSPEYYAESKIRFKQILKYSNSKNI